MRLSILLVLIGATMGACMNLDSNLFSPETNIEEYLLDGFEGEQEIELPDGEYEVSPAMIHRVEIPFINDHGSGSLLSGVYVGDSSKIGEDSVILYLHGNSGNIDFYWNRTRLLAHVGGKHRLGVLVIDYPGFGLSSGKPSIQNLIQAAKGAAEWLQEKGLRTGDLFLYGFSLGSIPALQSDPLLESQGETDPLCNKIILEAPIGSIQTMVEDASGLSFDASFFTSYYDNSNIDAIQSIDQAVLLLHGENDDFLSIGSHGIPVAEAYKGQALTFKKIKDAGHGDLPEVMGYENYIKELTDFIFL